MIYIVFFEDNSLANICSSLLKRPEKLYLVGDSRKRMERYGNAYRELFRKRGFSTDVEYRAVDRNNLAQIVTVLSRIVRNSPDRSCAIDLTGGDELCLVAAGIVYQQFRDTEKRPQLQKINIRTGKVIDCDEDGFTMTDPENPHLNIRELIPLFGGEILGIHRDRAGMSNEEKHVTDVLWSVCRRSPSDWNHFTSLLAKASVNQDAGRIRMSEKERKELLKTCSLSEEEFRSVGQTLREAGMIEVAHTETEWTFSFSSPFVRSCLTDPGRILEMRTLYALASLRHEDGRPLFNDAAQSVRIGQVLRGTGRKGSALAANEVDVLLMRKMVPYFISCKNGGVDNTELYKFQSVAERFGGKYAKKILIHSTAPSEISDLVRTRAEVFGVKLIHAEALDQPALYTRVLKW